MAIAKLGAEYHTQGVLFLGICPGMVDTNMNDYSESTDVLTQFPGSMLNMQSATEEQQKRGLALFQKFQEYEPSFKGPDTPEDSIKAVLSVIEKSSVEGGQSGGYLSHFGTKRWL